MNKSEIKARVTALLSSGAPKAEVFANLAGQGVKDSKLAYLIAAYADPRRCNEHDGKVNIAITLMLIQALIACGLGYSFGAQIGPKSKWILGGLTASIPLLFAWGFYAHRVGAYNAYILLALIQTPKGFKDFALTPIGSSIGIAIGLAMLAYVWYVRDRIFPDFGFVTPKKAKGQYIFKN